jgi:dephospho-CoA kinase
MVTIGVTGGIGSGKTAVCGILERLGAHVFYADLVAKRLMERDPNLVEEIREAFGPESYDAEGRLNRSYLARRVFSSEKEVARINAMVHPRVFAAFEEERREVEAQGVPMMVKEAALIFQSGGDRHLDAVVVVDADLDERIERVRQRDGVPREAIQARMRHQMSAEEMRTRADYVIENTGTQDELEARVRALYRSLVS